MPARSIAIAPASGNRHLLTAPILLWSLLIIPSLLAIPDIAPVVESMRDNALYQLRGVTVPLLDHFYSINLLDRVFGQLVTAFGLLQFHQDSRSYWHALDSIAQFGSIYAGLLLESSRNAHGSALLFWTIVVSLLGRLTTAGIILPVYFYFLHVSTTLPSLVSRRGYQELDNASALAVLPTVALTFYLPHFASFLGPDLTSRHWWNWVWQLHGVWGAVLFFGLSSMFAALPRMLQLMPTVLAKRVKLHNRLKATRLVAVCLGMINTGTYWYVLGNSSHSWWDIYVPEYFFRPATDPEAALGTILQFDYICVFGSAITWLGYQFADLKASGLVTMSWIQMVILGAVVGVVLGPGTLWWVGWMAREEILASLQPKQAWKKIN